LGRENVCRQDKDIAVIRGDSPPILKIKRFRGFKVDLTLNLGTDESRIQHAMIVVGTNVGSS